MTHPLRPCSAESYTRSGRGVSLIEVLIGIVIITIAAIGTLSYFSFGLGNVNKQGNKRAALERAREQLEALLAADINTAMPTNNGVETLYWCNATPSPCASKTSWVTSVPSKTVLVDNAARRVEVTAKWRNDASVDTPGLETLELGAKVWFMSGSVDDDFNRVYLKTLRTP